MTRKNAILILMIVIAISLFVISFIVFFNSEEKQQEIQIEVPQEQTFFPINNNERDPKEEEFEPIDNPLNEFSIPRLRQISNVPVAGFTVFERIATTSNTFVDQETGNESNEEVSETITIYRYMERSTGHIYETSARSLDVERISNTTIPKVYRANFLNNGEDVVIQYLDDNGNIETFVANLIEPEVLIDETSTSTEENDDIVLVDELMKLEGEFLPSNIIDLSTSPNQEDLFYLIGEEQSNFVMRSGGYITNLSDLTKKEKTLNNPATEWVVNWPNENVLTLTSNPSAFANGFLYFLNTNTGSFTKILEGFSGFNSLTNSDLTKVIYTNNSQRRPNLNLYDLKEKENYNLEITTFVDKCVWGNKDIETAYCAIPRQISVGDYPDDWYQGTVSFTDTLGEINWEENIIREIPGLTIPFDIINPQISENDDYFVFINKKDLTLWSFDLSI